MFSALNFKNSGFLEIFLTFTHGNVVSLFVQGNNLFHPYKLRGKQDQHILKCELSTADFLANLLQLICN